MTSSMSYYRTQLADAELRKISKSFAESTDSPSRHKCFLSYYSADAEEVLAFVEKYDDVFIPRVVGVTEDDPAIQSDDTGYVMDRIREKYLSNSTVTIVLVGQCTWSRKYIDWEVYGSLRKDPVNRLNGLMAIELPSVAGGNGTLPTRVSDNVSGVNGLGGYARYWKYPRNGGVLQEHIQDAFDARWSRDSLIRNSRDRRMRNSPCT